MTTKSIVTRAFAFLTTAAALLGVAGTPAKAYQELQKFNQPAQRGVEASLITVVACNGQGENGGQRYLYQYTQTRFRAINPPNYGQALGGHDWGTFQQAVSAACLKQVASPAPQSNPSTSPNEWYKCSDENGTCNFGGTKSVAYGANGRFFFKTATNGIACNNSVFGDPIVGTRKVCYMTK